jgi:uncharacterized protein YdeI (BOF family)
MTGGIMRFLTISVVAAVLVAGMVGCKTTTVSKYGKAIPTGTQVVPAKDILDNPAGFDGKEVVVTGKITSECPSGGWVWVKDASGEIYVNMHPTNVFIPQKVGKTVKAMGTVVLEEGRPQVVGTGLEF